METIIKNQKKPKFSRRNMAFLGMVVGMFMAILDIQIVASSLHVIAAGLSASQDELSWVQTSYLIAEVIIIPLSGFAARLLSTRISYSIAALGFTIMSVMCAFATNLESMIIFRAFQGFFGGAMIPTVFATIFMVFEPKERPLVSVIIGLVVTMAPTLGPTIGGYITDATSWHFMFLLNVIPGIFVCTIVFLFADFDEPDYSLLEDFDYIGVILLISTLGIFQYILEEGARKLWFESDLIIGLSLYVVFGLFFLIYHELTTAKPILNLRAFRHRNFAIGCVLSGVLGIGLYGSVFLLPVFLGNSAGLDTLQIGIIMGVMGISQFISAPVAGMIMKTNPDRRIMMFFGLIAYGFGCYLNSFLTPDSRFYELMLPQMIRGFSAMFCFIPINDMALSALPRNEIQNASGLYNLMRNLGGAFGLAIINLKVNDDSVINRDIISSNVPETSEIAQNGLANIANMVDGQVGDVEAVSLTILNNLMVRDSFIISINNAFAHISVLYFLSLFLIFFASKMNIVTENEPSSH